MSFGLFCRWVLDELATMLFVCNKHARIVATSKRAGKDSRRAGYGDGFVASCVRALDICKYFSYFILFYFLLIKYFLRFLLSGHK